MSQRTSYGPVQLDMDAQDYSGCVALSNNSAELSAIPQILVRILMWRKRRLDQMQQLAAEGRAAGLHDEAAEINDIDDFERPTTLVLKKHTRKPGLYSPSAGSSHHVDHSLPGGLVGATLNTFVTGDRSKCYVSTEWVVRAGRAFEGVGAVTVDRGDSCCGSYVTCLRSCTGCTGSMTPTRTTTATGDLRAPISTKANTSPCMHASSAKCT